MDFRWPTELAQSDLGLPSRVVSASEVVTPEHVRSQLRALRALWCSVVAYAIHEGDTECVLSPHWFVLCNRAGLDPEHAIAARMRYLGGLIKNMPRVITDLERLPYGSQEEVPA